MVLNVDFHFQKLKSENIEKFKFYVSIKIFDAKINVFLSLHYIYTNDCFEVSVQFSRTNWDVWQAPKG